MELLRKAENLAEAYALFDPDRPLEGKWLDRFASQPEPAGIRRRRRLVVRTPHRPAAAGGTRG